MPPDFPMQNKLKKTDGWPRWLSRRVRRAWHLHWNAYHREKFIECSHTWAPSPITTRHWELLNYHADNARDLALPNTKGSRAEERE